MASSSYGDVEEALLRARIQLALDQPFLASAVLRLPIRECAGVSWCATMATDGYHIFYNPEWVGPLSEPELRGVLAHEVLHVVFAHADRRAGRDAKRWNLAADIVINLLLVEQGFELPAGGVFMRRFGGLPTEVVYDKLSADSALTVARGGRATPGEESDVPGIVVDPGADLVDADDPRVVPMQGADMLDQEARAELVGSLRQEIGAKLHGRAAAMFRQDLVAAEQGQLDWKALLRQWLQDRVKHDWSAPPWSKRHIHRGIYMPSPSVQAPGHVVFAIDTSGSMGEDELAAAMAEVRAYRETFPCRLTVIQADARVQSVTTYEELDGVEVPRTTVVHGRGGTDCRPVFEWIDENADAAPTVLIYATDGYGTFPANEPPWPTIWIITRVGVANEQLPFGVCVRLR